MKKFFFDCTFTAVNAPDGPRYTGVIDVTADGVESARLALLDRCAHAMPGLKLVKGVLLFSRCESLTEFIRKAA